MNYLVLITFGILTASTLGQNDSDESEMNMEELDNEAFIKKFDEVAANTACEWMGISDPNKLKINLDREISFQDVAKLTFLNKGKKLSENQLEFPDDIRWKRELINFIWSIFTTACPDIHVSKKYMNIMRELAMVYINSVEPRNPSDPEVWTALLESLYDCDSNENLTMSYEFTSRGLLVEKFIVKKSKPNNDDDDTLPTGNETSISEPEIETLMDLSPPLENAQADFMLDIIIENLWYVFSHAWARCMPTAPSKELWAPRLKLFFFRDILAPLEKRWMKPGNLRKFLDLIVGDYDIDRYQYNIPYCTQAAYVNPAGTHLTSQLVRPIKLTEISKGVSKFQNKRVTLMF